MSALVRLYPAAWRARYEEEFLALLEAWPPTAGDRFDIVRGAIDARLHPQVREAAAATRAVRRARVRPASLRGASVSRRWRASGSGSRLGRSWRRPHWSTTGMASYRDGSASAPFLLLSGDPARRGSRGPHDPPAAEQADRSDRSRHRHGFLAALVGRALECHPRRHRRRRPRDVRSRRVPERGPVPGRRPSRSLAAARPSSGSRS